MFKQIHEITFHGKGGYTFFDVYAMPIWMRKFVFHEIKTYYEELDKAQNKKDNEIDLANPDRSKIPAYAAPQNSKPQVSPKVNSSTTYTTKMSKK